MQCVISVLGKDQSGIVAAVSGALAQYKVNIDDISQTILDSIFSMTMMVTINTDVAAFNEVQEALNKVADELGVQITIQREELFHAMYKI